MALPCCRMYLGHPNLHVQNLLEYGISCTTLCAPECCIYQVYANINVLARHYLSASGGHTHATPVPCPMSLVFFDCPACIVCDQTLKSRWALLRLGPQTMHAEYRSVRHVCRKIVLFGFDRNCTVITYQYTVQNVVADRKLWLQQTLEPDNPY